MHYEAVICQQISEAGDGESFILGSLCIVFWVMWKATRLCHNDFGVTKSTQNMDANMCKLEILRKASFAGYTQIHFNEIKYISNTNPAQFYKKKILDNCVVWLR